jgi:hypothetical protein
MWRRGGLVEFGPESARDARSSKRYFRSSLPIVPMPAHVGR